VNDVRALTPIEQGDEDIKVEEEGSGDVDL
jgi:hypothetical protein